MKTFLFALVALIATTQAVNFISSDGKWMPDHYSTGDDDQLMKNLIEQGLAFTKDKGFDDKYPFMTKKGCGCTQQSCVCCMTKHTHYWIDKAGAYAAAREIVGVNLHLEGRNLQQYLADHFEDMWAKYDVIKTGWVEVERMSMFYKELMGDWKIAI